MKRPSIKLLTLDLSLKGGIERVVSLLSNSFDKIGYDVEIVSLFRTNITESYSINEGVKVKYLSEIKYQNNTGINKWRVFYQIIKSVTTYALSEHSKNTILISTLTNISTIMGAIKILKPQLKIIAAEHSQYNAHGDIVRILRKVFYKHCDKVILLTEHDKRIFEKFIDKNKINVIRNPVSFEINQASGLEFKRLITIGRLEQVKGYRNLINDLAVFFKKHPSWTLDIYGEGSLKDELNSLIVELDLSHNIFLKGFARNLDVEIRKSSFYLCSSFTEAFPMSFLEAFSVGLPVISRNCPIGPSEIIQHRINGILLNETEDFSSSLDSLIMQNQKYADMVSECIKSVEEYKISKITQEWVKLFNEINND